MSFLESLRVQWILLASLVAAWGLSFSIQQTLEGSIVSIVGMATLLILIFTYMQGDSTIRVFWDESRGTLAVIRKWTVEVCALRLIQSVPLGIDLSHSAIKVLNAMNTRYQDEPDGSLEWVVCRPLGASKTRVGFMVSRRGYRLPHGVRRMEILSDSVVEDAYILESAMRAAYPHTPIGIASAEDIKLIRHGGVEPIEAIA